MGPTGAGKSSQGDLLAEDLRGAHLSSGELLRRDPVTAVMISDGRLAAAEEVHRVLEDAIKQVPEDRPVVMDGTPRTMADVGWLERAMPGLHRELERVVLINIDVETALKRLKPGVRDRGDDAPAAVREKWKLFEQITRPVVDHYRELGLLEEVDGRGSIAAVHAAIKSALAKAARR
jgi:adenylate kinase